MGKQDVISGLKQKRKARKLRKSRFFCNSEIFERIFIDFMNILKSIQKMTSFVIDIVSGTSSLLFGLP